MSPQVFEKAFSAVNNLRKQQGRPFIRGHFIAVIDLQDAGSWDWTQGEPPRDDPAYYLRFCKTFARMAGELQYLPNRQHCLPAVTTGFVKRRYHPCCG